MNLSTQVPTTSKKSFLFSFLLLLACCLHAQTFQTAIGYGFPTEERGVSGLVDNNGNYVVLAGNFKHPSGLFNSSGDMELLRLNNLGNLILPSKIIGQDVAEQAVWMEKATGCNGNAGYIIAGNNVDSGNSDMLLTFTNPAGAPQWVKRIGSMNDDDHSACVKQDAAGNFILVGTKTDPNTGMQMIHAVKTDCSGALLWEQVYRLNGSAKAASVTAFATFPSNCGPVPANYYITGTISPATGAQEEVFILSVTVSNGTVAWMRSYDVAPNAADFGTCIQGRCSSTAPGAPTLWVSGYSTDTGQKQVLMMQTDIGGMVQWARNYDVANSKMEFATHFTFAGNHRLVLTGKAEETGASDPAETGLCLLLRMPENGASVDWTRVYDMGFSSHGNRVETVGNDEYFITGHLFEIVQPHQFDYNILAIRTDNLGQTKTDCYHSPNTDIIDRQPVLTPLQPTLITPQQLFPTSLTTVLIDDKQTFCPAQQINPCDTLGLNAAFTYSISGATVNFTDLSTVVSGSIFGWSWTFGDAGTSSLQNPTHTYANPGVYTVCLIITGGVAGILCTDTICKDIVVEMQHIDPCDTLGLTANFGISGLGNTLNFTDLSTIGSGGIFGWSWTFGDAGTSNLQNPTHTYAGPGVYTVCLIVTGGNAVALCHDTICKEVLVPFEPIDSCQGNIVLNGDFSQGLVPGNLGFGGAVSNWATWTNSPQVIAFDNCMDPGAIQMWGNQVVGESIWQSVGFVAGGIYQLEFCGKWLNQVQPNVQVRFRASQGFPATYQACGANCDEIFLSPVMNTNWTTYTSSPWTATQNYNTLTVSIWNGFAINDGAYVSWARIDDICIRRIGASATQEAGGAEAARIYPNPAGSEVTVEFSKPLEEDTQLSLLDMTGREILKLEAPEGAATQRIGLEQCPAGLYLLRAQSNGRVVWTQKMVKQ